MASNSTNKSRRRIIGPKLPELRQPRVKGIYAALAFLSALYQYLTLFMLNRGVTELLYFIPIAPIPIVYIQRAVIYLVLSVAALGVAWYFYNASLWNVSQYGNLIRSTYDLFRFDLLERLHLPLPKDNDEDDPEGELMTWKNLCELVNVGKIQDFVGEEVSTKSQLTQFDVMVVGTDNYIKLLIEIEDKASLVPNKIIGTFFTTLICNKFGFGAGKDKQYFFIYIQRNT